MENGVSVGDGQNLAAIVTGMVEQVLGLAATWTAWDGTPRLAEDRAYTPHKAIRRVADHLIDHLAEVEARLSGVPTLPDRWHASSITTASDLAVFTPEDLDEATSRLTRLATVWQVRLRSLSDEQLDRTEPGAWSVRQIATHLGGSTFYAEAVGRLG